MSIRLLGNILVLCLIVIFVLVVLMNISLTTANDRGTTWSIVAQKSPCANGEESGLPLPSSFLPAKLPEFQAQLKSFLTSGKYKTPDWGEEKKLRDTGP